MAWCPKCGCEYQEGVKKCADCGLRLIDHQPGKDELIPANDTPRPTGLRRIFTRVRVLHMLRALIAVLLALAAAYTLEGML